MSFACSPLTWYKVKSITRHHKRGCLPKATAQNISYTAISGFQLQKVISYNLLSSTQPIQALFRGKMERLDLLKMITFIDHLCELTSYCDNNKDNIKFKTCKWSQNLQAADMQNNSPFNS